MAGTFPFKETVEVEWLRGAALLAFDQRRAKGAQFDLMLFEKAQPGPDDLAGGAVSAMRKLPIDEAAEMIAEGNGGVPGHAAASEVGYQYIAEFGTCTGTASLTALPDGDLVPTMRPR